MCALRFFVDNKLNVFTCKHTNYKFQQISGKYIVHSKIKIRHLLEVELVVIKGDILLKFLTYCLYPVLLSLSCRFLPRRFLTTVDFYYGPHRLDGNGDDILYEWHLYVSMMMMMM